MAELYVLTVMIGDQKPYELPLTDIEARGHLSFGRHPQNDIVIPSPIVSNTHGQFVYRNETLYIVDHGSLNGVYVQSARIDRQAPLHELDRITFEADDAQEDGGENRVLLILSRREEGAQSWTFFQLTRKPALIGRDAACDIYLPQVNIAQKHARIFCEAGEYRIAGCGTEAVFVNGKRIDGAHALAERDMIMVGGASLLYGGGLIHYSRENPRIGIRLDAVGKRVRVKASHRVLLENTSLSIASGSFVAIIGGSGAGKSTLMNGLCGVSSFTSGQVLYNSQELYAHYEALRMQIGYVPQDDIVFSDLTLRQMLRYTARLRMPADSTPAEWEARVDDALDAVELTKHQQTLIGKLSGGQRKRASIAVELISDPGVYFMDEPTSGLDPGTERRLMRILKRMTERHKTVVLVTHMTANVGMCDQLIVLGAGGKLCFCGTPAETLAFFQVEDFVDIYDKLNQNAAYWQARFASTRDGLHDQENASPAPVILRAEGKRRFFKQLQVLCARYIALLAADRKRLLMLLLQAPLLGILLCVVAGRSSEISLYRDASRFRSFALTLACSSFWVGMLGAIQEICKERTIFRRERMAGLRTWPYLLSKLAVLSGVCLIQSLSLVAVVAAFHGLPPSVSGLGVPPWLALFVTVFLTGLSAMGFGLSVSCLSPTPDRALTLAPILLMLQILLADVVFNLTGTLDKLSYLIGCRASVWALYILVDINALVPMALQDAAYQPLLTQLLVPWGLLAGMFVLFVGLSAYALALQEE